MIHVARYLEFKLPKMKVSALKIDLILLEFSCQEMNSVERLIFILLIYFIKEERPLRNRILSPYKGPNE